MDVIMCSDIKAAIVIIDDDGLFVENISSLPSLKGFRVYSAVTVQAGLELIDEVRPELALLSYQVTSVNTPIILQEVESRCPGISIALSIASHDSGAIEELTRESAIECIIKPLNIHSLAGRLNTMLRLRELTHANRRLQLEQEQLQCQLEVSQQEYHRLLKEKAETLRKAHFEITQTEKLAAMGFLAAGMAHDVRNPLNSISLFTQLLRQNISDPDQKEYLGKIIKEVERIDSIIHSLLNVSRRSRNMSATVRMDQVIDDALDVFAPQIEAGNIQLVRNYHVVPPPIKANPDELKQIFTNLFLNALDEMPNGGRLGIGITIEDGMVVIRVEDSGNGIPDQNLPNIFEPFFTTKPQGIGIGLPVVKRIARIYGGSIAVEKSTSDGTVLRLAFPFRADPGKTGFTPGPSKT